MSKTTELITSIYDRRLEVHYNNRYFKNKEGKVTKLELQGKIKCPILNSQISSIVCSQIMDKPGWPRNVDPTLCKQCNCYISVSIQRHQNIKRGKDGSRNSESKDKTDIHNR